ncbi:hypothetical protein BH11ACT8_BH11ACT8_17590 [soil metagenome]
MTIGGLVVALALVVGSVLVVRSLVGSEDRSRLAGAMHRAPQDAVRFSWTDWTAVRERLGVKLDASSSGALVQDLLDRGFDADLTSTTALGSSAVEMQGRLGFSPASLDWELFSQGETGASLLLKPGPSITFDDVRAKLEASGYAPPAKADGLWIADPGSDAITTLVTPELNVVAFDEGSGLMITSDTDSGARIAIAALGHDDDAPLTDDVLSAAGDPLSASLYTGAEVCGALAMARADPTEQANADQLLADAGRVNPISGFAIASEPDTNVRVVMSFESADQARTNADTRAALASGPAPGQGGDFADRFTLGDVTAEGDVVTMELEPVEGSYVLSDLSTGPVLFATC